MASKKTTIDKLDTAIAEIMEEYGDHIQENLDLITKNMGKKGAAALRQESKKKLKQHTGEYAKGWKYEFRQTKRYSKTTIFNEHYGLPHLLEYGHAIRSGGRTVGSAKAFPHIKDAELHAEQRLLNRIQKGIEGNSR